ncbi:MAG: lactate oxidase, partial [Oxalobacter sp.]|nr:lactate oxidase [Oxalobacter sp.]
MMKKHIQAVAVVSAIIFSQAVMAQGTKNAPVISDAEGPIKIINLYDLEKEASTKVAKGAFGYVEGGAEDEVTMRSNSTAFDKKKILPNGLAGIDGVNLKTTFLGVELASPIIIAPMAAHGLVHKEADRATIRGT